MSKSHPDFSPLSQDYQIPQPASHTRTRKSFILKSLSIILLLTVLVLGINYYLISNCPSDGQTASSQQPNSITVLQRSETTEQHALVTVSVFYEVLCPDSKQFLLHHVIPVKRRFGPLVNIRLVPFGKARFSGPDDDLQFSCQHGPEECHGNKLHGCMLESHGSDQSLVLQMIGCTMEKYRLWGATINSINAVTTECRQKYAPSDDSPLLCTNASALLKQHGQETLSLKPAVTFIPTITIDGSQSGQPQMLRDLTASVCKQLKRHSLSLDC